MTDWDRLGNVEVGEKPATDIITMPILTAKIRVRVIEDYSDIGKSPRQVNTVELVPDENYQGAFLLEVTI